jgi:diguanylate cyclase (GGDEF)-like protein
MTMSRNQDSAVAVLAKIATEFSALTVSLPVFLNRALSVLGQELGMDNCVVALLDERGAGRLVVRAASGLAAARLGKPLHPDVYARVMDSGRAELIPDPGPDTGPAFRSCVGAPIVVHGRAIGLLSAYRPHPGQFTEHDVNLMVVVARYFSSAIELARLHEQPLAGPQTDPLTDLESEPAFRDVLERELRRGQRHEEPTALLCLDIDGFAAIREKYDAVLQDTLVRNLAKLVRSVLRETDRVARSSSGLLLLLPRTPKRAGISVAERIRQRASTVVAESGPSITVSLGVSESPHDGAFAEALLAAARSALQEAQRQGGDRVQAARAAT